MGVRQLIVTTTMYDNYRINNSGTQVLQPLPSRSILSDGGLLEKPRLGSIPSQHMGFMTKQVWSTLRFPYDQPIIIMSPGECRKDTKGTSDTDTCFGGQNNTTVDHGDCVIWVISNCDSCCIHRKA